MTWHMANNLIQLVIEYVPAPLLWAAGGAASCCFGLALGLRLVNPMAFEILMADEDDEDAYNNAIGQPTLNIFAQCVLISVLVNGCVSWSGLDSNVSVGCCALSLVGVGALTARTAFHDVHKAGQDMVKERKGQDEGLAVERGQAAARPKKGIKRD